MKPFEYKKIRKEAKRLCRQHHLMTITEFAEESETPVATVHRYVNRGRLKYQSLGNMKLIYRSELSSAFVIKYASTHYTVAQYALLRGVNRTQVYGWIKRGLLHADTKFNQKYIPKAELELDLLVDSL